MLLLYSWSNDEMMGPWGQTPLPSYTGSRPPDCKRQTERDTKRPPSLCHHFTSLCSRFVSLCGHFVCLCSRFLNRRDQGLGLFSNPLVHISELYDGDESSFKEMEGLVTYKSFGNEEKLLLPRLTLASKCRCNLSRRCISNRALSLNRAHMHWYKQLHPGCWA